MDTKEAGFVILEHVFEDRFKDGEEIRFKFRFKPASGAAVERCQAKANKNPGLAFRGLCVSCVHSDDKQAMLDAFEAYPGLPTTFGNALLTDAGFGELGN